MTTPLEESRKELQDNLGHNGFDQPLVDYAVKEAHRIYTAAAEQMVAEANRRIIELQSEVKHERDRRLVSDAKRDRLRNAIEDVLCHDLGKAAAMKLLQRAAYDNDYSDDIHDLVEVSDRT